jgi:hypothetical protein
MIEQDAGSLSDDGWEALPEVDAQEIDRIIASLNEIMERTKSPVVLEILEDACCDLAELVDLEDDDEELSEAA